MKIWRWWMLAIAALVAGHAQAETGHPKFPQTPTPLKSLKHC